MIKTHKNSKKISIQWDGDLNHSDAGNKNQNIPKKIEKYWGKRYIPNFERSGCRGFPDGYIINPANCADGVMDEPKYFEDFDFNYDELINVTDIVALPAMKRQDLTNTILLIIINGADAMGYPKAPLSEYTNFNDWTWGDVSFIQEIMDGIGTGSRRERQDRLNKFDDGKKKKLIHLICRVKGEKVYDEKKEVGDIQIKLEDAELVINEILNIKVEKTNVL